MKLGGNTPPWVPNMKHLGNHINNNSDGAQYDAEVKSAMYVQKNVSICQEFYFSHFKTKLKINNVYNMHFTGFELWDLFGHRAQKLEATYNRSVKIMCGLPYGTHRYFIEDLTEKEHLKKTLMKRYLKFMRSMMTSPKKSLVKLLSIVKNDVQSVTGSNLRGIMLLCNLNNIDDLVPDVIDNFKYCTPPEGEEWRLGFIKELLDVQEGNLEVEGFQMDDVKCMIDDICIT